MVCVFIFHCVTVQAENIYRSILNTFNNASVLEVLNYILVGCPCFEYDIRFGRTIMSPRESINWLLIKTANYGGYQQILKNYNLRAKENGRT